jgi:hypothetical protein
MEATFRQPRVRKVFMLNLISIIVENENEARRKQLNNLGLTKELIEAGCPSASDYRPYFQIQFIRKDVREGNKKSSCTTHLRAGGRSEAWPYLFQHLQR